MKTHLTAAGLLLGLAAHAQKAADFHQFQNIVFSAVPGPAQLSLYAHLTDTLESKPSRHVPRQRDVYVVGQYSPRWAVVEYNVYYYFLLQRELLGLRSGQDVRQASTAMHAPLPLNEQHMLDYTQVIEVPGASKDELYARGKIWWFCFMKKTLVLSLFALSSALGCTKQEEQTALPLTSADAGSFRLEGHLVNCKAIATSSYILSSTDSLESIFVQLNDTSAPTGDSPFLNLDFSRTTSRPNAPYLLESATYCGYSDKPCAIHLNLEATLRETSPGVVSGTFYDTKPEQSPIMDGHFTNVRVRPYVQPE